jgi:predicted nucleic acid-binding protein
MSDAFARSGSVIYDTDILIWVLRGNTKAAALLREDEERCLSLVSYMELLRGARNRREVSTIQGFLRRQAFRSLPLTENVGHRAAIYVEEYGLKAGLGVADAIIGATAAENGLMLVTGNRKHFAVIRDLQLRAFRAH